MSRPFSKNSGPYPIGPFGAVYVFEETTNGRSHLPGRDPVRRYRAAGFLSWLTCLALAVLHVLKAAA